MDFRLECRREGSGICSRMFIRDGVGGGPLNRHALEYLQPGRADAPASSVVSRFLPLHRSARRLGRLKLKLPARLRDGEPQAPFLQDGLEVGSLVGYYGRVHGESSLRFGKVREGSCRADSSES